MGTEMAKILKTTKSKAGSAFVFDEGTRAQALRLLKSRRAPGSTWGSLLQLFGIAVVPSEHADSGSSRVSIDPRVADANTNDASANASTISDALFLSEADALRLAHTLYAQQEWWGLGRLVEEARFLLPDLAQALLEKAKAASVDEMFDGLLTEGALTKDAQSAEQAAVMIAESRIVSRSRSSSMASRSRSNSMSGRIKSNVADRDARAQMREERDWMRVLVIAALRQPRGAKLAQRLLKRMKGGKPDATALAVRFPEVLRAQKRSKLMWMLRQNHLDLIPCAVEETAREEEQMAAVAPQNRNSTQSWMIQKLRAGGVGGGAASGDDEDENALDKGSFGPSHPLTRYLEWKWLQRVDSVDKGDGGWTGKDGDAAWLSWVDTCLFGLGQNGLGQKVSTTTTAESSFLTLEDVSLAPESIVWVGDDAMAEEVSHAICSGGEKCIGFDSEWHPLYPDEISLVQIATTTQCFLFDARALSSPTTWAGILATFSAGGEGKQLVGFGLRGDLAMVNKAVSRFTKGSGGGSGARGGTSSSGGGGGGGGSNSLHLTLGPGVVELQKMAAKDTSLSSMCAQVLGKALDKRCTVSDWFRRPLGTPQRNYAALDAFCCVKILEKKVAVPGKRQKKRKTNKKSGQ
jgi:hypothetical protein